MCLPFSGDLSSSIRPKCISRIELGDVGRGSHSIAKVSIRSDDRVITDGINFPILYARYRSVLGSILASRQTAEPNIALLQWICLIARYEAKKRSRQRREEDDAVYGDKQM